MNPQDPSQGPLNAPDNSSSPWAASIGSWCGPGDAQTTWLVANPAPSTCGTQSQHIVGEGSSDGFSVELSPAQLATLPTPISTQVRYCVAGQCETTPATIELQSFIDGTGTPGTFRLTLSDNTTLTGTFDAGPCPWDDHLPAHPDGNLLATDITLQEVAIYQAVKIPLMQEQGPVNRNAPVVAGRAALVRAFVSPSDSFQPQEVRARLTLTTPTTVEDQVFEQTLTVQAASADDDINSTFNFELPPEVLDETTQYSVELLSTVRCPSAGEAMGARFPKVGVEDLGAQDVGPIKVEVIPIRYETDGSGRLPDTSEAQMQAFETLLMQLYPVSSVELTVRPEPVSTTGRNFIEIVEQIRSLRADENPPDDLAYYGVFNPDDTLEEYCPDGCAYGIAPSPTAELLEDPVAGVAVGIGFTDEVAIRTFAHEVGHVMGRSHTPCDGLPGDDSYPHTNGSIGSWGYGLLNQQLYSPDGYSDLMSYCNPAWISDHVYSYLAEFISKLNLSTQQSRLAVPPQTWRTLLVESDAAPQWGLRRVLHRPPTGRPEFATVLDQQGNPVTQVQVRRTQLEHFNANFLDVPEPTESAWAALQLQDGRVIEFGGTSFVEPFGR